MARTQETNIALSRRAFWYFLGYHAWQALRRSSLWLLVIAIGLTAFDLIKTGRISGMSDAEIATAFLVPLLPVVIALAIGALAYGLTRATIATLTTRYHLTRQGIMTEVGWLTRRTTLVNYDQIQKVTIVANPYDRILKSAYIYLDLIGGATGVALEAIDSTAVADLQGRLAQPLPNALSNGSNATLPPAKKNKRKRKSKKK